MQDNPLRRWMQGLGRKNGQLPVLVKELGERDRRRMLRHLLALDRDDRLLRFGSMVPDEQITAYIGKIDFANDIVFGVFNNVFSWSVWATWRSRRPTAAPAPPRSGWPSSGCRYRRRRAGRASARDCSSAPRFIAATRMSTRSTCSA